MKALVFILIIALLISTSLFYYYWKKEKEAPIVRGPEIRYVPIGDSYTIGEGVSSSESFPQLLTEHLRKSGYNVNLVINPAEGGWTTQDAIDRELPVIINSKPDFATLLIGANDIVHSIDDGRFRDRFVYLVDHMLGVLPDRKSLVLITIPDFSVTKVGAEFGDPPVVAAAISRFNAIIKEEGEKRGLQVVDIFPLTQQMGHDPSLINPDNLHPSAKEYAVWEREIVPEVEKLLKTKT